MNVDTIQISVNLCPLRVGSFDILKFLEILCDPKDSQNIFRSYRILVEDSGHHKHFETGIC